MIIKNIFKIHYLFYLVAFICIITGFFKPFLWISLLIIVHELGHFLTAVYYKWQIDKIIIFPFGGVTIFKEHLNKPIKEEFVILIMGPIIQIIFYLIITHLFGYNQQFAQYHYALLVFNLMPIFPLDGSKLVKLGLEKILPFKLSHLLTLFISIIFLIIFIIFIYLKKMNLVLILFLILLLIKIFEEIKQHQIIFNKFLFERYLYNFNFPKIYFIKNGKITKMKKGYRHIFFSNNKYVTEKELLHKRFDFNMKV